MSLAVAIGVAVGSGAGSGGAPAANPNLLLWTEEFDNAVWTKSGVSVSADAATDPYGGATADRVTCAAAGTLSQTTTIAATTGVDVTTPITVAAPDAWERFSVTGTFDGAPYTFSGYLKNDGTSVRMRLGRSAGFLRCAIEDVGDEAVYDIWGAKLEAGAGATTYQHRTT